MPEGSVGLEIQGKQKRSRPDLVGFYKSEIVDVLTQNESFLPLSSSTKGGNRSSNITENCEEMDSISCASSLFSNSIGNVIPNVNKELLKASLRQSVGALTREFEEVFDPVIRIRHVISYLNSKRKDNSSAKPPIFGNSTTLHAKKFKRSCLTSRRGPLVDQSRDAEKETDVDEDLKLLLESEPILVEEIMTKHSNELHKTLDHLEQQLEELLYVVVSKCRLMTGSEKQHLRKLIEKLPAMNLDRIVEILHHGKSSDTVSLDTIFVDLEEQENTTLWRLYFYVKAVENARKLSA
ncbi:Transcription factor GTE6 [Bienertia sinuspersici]